ncbi:hypothetical protein OF117_02860 [Geodermatophilus sp. YIM 151500]|uniref:hypothetical protein n=1 Tax=Geodermatophilus sp. YIM 151500 TaxID=2984531 RepID=UPI0021E3ABF6|nr:hypothetical protein [Geodermatophilus sp. YIM 151500]MCV2488290.1 hypothetical protein [Geodermatophilus sp. YIM 151500]
MLALAVGAPLLVVVTSFVAFDAPSEPPSPRAAAEEYFEAITAERWDVAWDLLCSADRRDEQARRRYIDHWEESARLLPPLGDDPFTAARVRPDERSSVPAFFVEMVLPEDYGSLPLGEVHVVWEDDAFHVCFDA